jgi:epsilon-lactone hydrolase
MTNERPIDQVRQMLAGLIGGPDTPWQDRRAQTEAFAAAFVAPPGVRFQAGNLGGVPCEWVLPAEGSPTPIFMHFHGGGYVMGMPAASRTLTSQLALSRAMRVVSVDYRLAPEHPFPAAVEDAVAAYRALLHSGISAKYVAFGGESAGGGLTIAALIAARDEGLPMPACAVVVSPWTDMTCKAASFDAKALTDPLLTRKSLSDMAAAYLGGANPRTPLASPNFGDLRRLPPLLIHVGSEEVLLDDAMALLDAARGQGVDATIEIWEDMIHVWHMFHPMLPQSGEAIEQLARFMRKHW